MNCVNPLFVRKIRGFAKGVARTVPLPIFSVFFRFLPFFFRFLPCFLPFFSVFFLFSVSFSEKKTGRHRSRDPFCGTPRKCTEIDSVIFGEWGWGSHFGSYHSCIAKALVKKNNWYERTKRQREGEALVQTELERQTEDTRISFKYVLFETQSRPRSSFKLWHYAVQKSRMGSNLREKLK